MDIAVDRLEFAPPATPGLLRSLGLALLAHAFLLAALTWGVHWTREAARVSVEAELWSALPQEAAPKLVAVAPEPPAAPIPTPPAPPQAQPQPSEADIALERDKHRLEKESELKKQHELEQQRMDRQRREQIKQENVARDKKRFQDKLEQGKKAAQEKKLAAEAARRKDALQAQQEAEAKKIEAQRQYNLKHIGELADATGAQDAKGTASHSSGPSAGYKQRLAALFKKNLNYPNPESISGNPKATVEVRVSASGLIMSSRLVTSSGVSTWDSAVLRAVDKTERIPADENGNFVFVFPVVFGPKD